MLKNLDKLIDDFIAVGIPSIDICVMHHGNVVYRRMDGYSDAARTKPINGTERYNIYSCSKPITVTAAMQLFERGKFSLDDCIADYMPEFANMQITENGKIRPAKHQITIRHLLTMTAGLTYNLGTANIMLGKSETKGCCQTREMMKYIARDPLAFDPGEKYNYSLCHDVLAAFVEELAEERFGEYVKKNIFAPLGMEESTFLPTDNEIAGLAEQYSFDNAEQIFKPIGGRNGFIFGSEYESGGAGCVTSVNDYMKFLEGWRTGKLLKRETLDLITQNQLTDELIKDFSLREYGYGYGLGLRCEYNGSGSTDFGWGGAAGAYLACDLKHDFTIFHAQHVLSSPNQLKRNLSPGAIRMDLDE